MRAMKRSEGFTVIELLVVVVFLISAGALLLVQRNSLEATQRDSDRKTAINAMYYNLEEVYFKQNGHYPASISSETLEAMDPELFTDPDGYELGEPDGNYRYESKGCNEKNECEAYELTAELEREGAYTKTNREASNE